MNFPSTRAAVFLFSFSRQHSFIYQKQSPAQQNQPNNTSPAAYRNILDMQIILYKKRIKTVYVLYEV